MAGESEPAAIAQVEQRDFGHGRARSSRKAATRSRGRRAAALLESDKSGSRERQPRAVAATAEELLADRHPCMTSKRPELSLLRAIRRSFVSVRWVVEVRPDRPRRPPEKVRVLPDRQALVVGVVAREGDHRRGPPTRSIPATDAQPVTPLTLPRSVGVSVEAGSQVRTHRAQPPTSRDPQSRQGRARNEASRGQSRDARQARTPAASRRRASCRRSLRSPFRAEHVTRFSWARVASRRARRCPRRRDEAALVHPLGDGGVRPSRPDRRR